MFWKLQHDLKSRQADFIPTEVYLTSVRSHAYAEEHFS